MKLTINREDILTPLQIISGVVERKQTMPVLSNILLIAEEGNVSLTGTNMEVELVCKLDNVQIEAEGQITIPARKLVDICRSLKSDSVIQLSLEGDKLHLRSSKSHFSLSTLPADQFPNIEENEHDLAVTFLQKDFKNMLDATSFAMAQQDVRYYLNGMLLEVNASSLRSVATDGHRLATCIVEASGPETQLQLIVPRKGILELSKLLTEPEDSVTLFLSPNHIRAETGDFTFTSKLVDGKFPDYGRVIPKNGNKVILADRQELRQVFQRTAILSNEKYRGVRVLLTTGNLQVFANNPEQEEAEESIAVDYEGDSLEVGFNVSYLQDVLGVIGTDQAKITLSDANSSALLEESDNSDALYVVMPMRL